MIECVSVIRCIPPNGPSEKEYEIPFSSSKSHGNMVRGRGCTKRSDNRAKNDREKLAIC